MVVIVKIHATTKLCLTADNAAPGHIQLSAGRDIHAAAFLCIAAGDNAAVDGFTAIIDQYPQTAGALDKFMRFVCVTVRNRQFAALLHLDNTAFLRHSQHKAVQIQRHSAVDRQCIADSNILLQCNLGNVAVSQRGSQCVLHGNLRLSASV